MALIINTLRLIGDLTIKAVIGLGYFLGALLAFAYCYVMLVLLLAL
jgi:hypothetical protein